MTDKPKSLLQEVAEKFGTTEEQLRYEMKPGKDDNRVIYFEPQFNRWHDKIDCSVLLSQDEIEIRLLAEPPAGSRLCSICATVAQSCD